MNKPHRPPQKIQSLRKPDVLKVAGATSEACEHCEHPARVAVVAGAYVTAYLCCSCAEHLANKIIEATE